MREGDGHPRERREHPAATLGTSLLSGAPARPNGFDSVRCVTAEGPGDPGGAEASPSPERRRILKSFIVSDVAGRGPGIIERIKINTFLYHY